jgi:hypothetical protein
LEIDPNSRETVWQYTDNPRWNFFSPHFGGAQCLSNGNTLIIEGWFGGMFQVTSEGKVVWEYINEFNSSGWSINAFFRARQYTFDDIPQLIKK